MQSSSGPARATRAAASPEAAVSHRLHHRPSLLYSASTVDLTTLSIIRYSAIAQVVNVTILSAKMSSPFWINVNALTAFITMRKVQRVVIRKRATLAHNRIQGWQGFVHALASSSPSGSQLKGRVASTFVPTSYLNEDGFWKNPTLDFRLINYWTYVRSNYCFCN